MFGHNAMKINSLIASLLLSTRTHRMDILCFCEPCLMLGYYDKKIDPHDASLRLSTRMHRVEILYLLVSLVNVWTQCYEDQFSYCITLFINKDKQGHTEFTFCVSLVSLANVWTLCYED